MIAGVLCIATLLYWNSYPMYSRNYAYLSDHTAPFAPTLALKRLFARKCPCKVKYSAQR